MLHVVAVYHQSQSQKATCPASHWAIHSTDYTFGNSSPTSYHLLPEPMLQIAHDCQFEGTVDAALLLTHQVLMVEIRIQRSLQYMKEAYSGNQDRLCWIFDLYNQHCYISSHDRRSNGSHCVQMPVAMRFHWLSLNLFCIMGTCIWNWCYGIDALGTRFEPDLANRIYQELGVIWARMSMVTPKSGSNTFYASDCLSFLCHLLRCQGMFAMAYLCQAKTVGGTLCRCWLLQSLLLFHSKFSHHRWWFRQ